MGLIYKATNNINGKSYIGVTIYTSEKRIKQHYRDSLNPNSKEYNLYFHKALRKYGLSSFTISTLYDNVPKEQLEIAEICSIYIHSPEYNLTLGGEGCKGYVHTQEQNEYHSKVMTGKKHTEETKRQMSLSRKGKKLKDTSKWRLRTHSQETKNKMSESAKLRWKKKQNG